ncbi:MAG: hypothetical protein EBS82_07360 [Methylocystaceae bacterium]|nr:hypothetical protein [Methylocystaceae bacterium]
MAEYVELYIDQGSDFSTTVSLNDDSTNLPQNVTGSIVTSSLRRSLLSPNASSNLTCTLIDAANGEFILSMTAANTAILRPGSYLFDVKVYDTLSATTSRLIEGVMFVTPSVTK